MVSDMKEARKNYQLQEILTEKQLHQVIDKCVDNLSWKLTKCEMKPASEGISGFLGDHFRVTLHVSAGDGVKKIKLFVKNLPLDNKPKADFIHDKAFFKRENLVYSLIEQMGEEPTYCSTALIHTDSVIMMPDLSFEGYAPRPYADTLDLQHVLVAATSVARYHAAFSNYETKMLLDTNHTFDFLKQYSHIVNEPSFADTPWLRTGAKLAANMVRTFSSKPYKHLLDLEPKLARSFVEACAGIAPSRDSLNVLVHKDLWNNNIMFKHENGVPTNAILVDFQCVLYCPPSIDVMLMLYLTTSRSFREQNEKAVFDRYYSTFMECLDEPSKARARSLKYDHEEFLRRCESSKKFGLLGAISIMPYTLMDPETAMKEFDDPNTFEKFTNEDRTEPVERMARKSASYLKRVLEVVEEFIERYVVNENVSS